MLLGIGCSHINLQNNLEALTLLYKLFQIKQNATLNLDKDNSIAVIFYEFGRCYHFLESYKVALANSNYSLHIKQNATFNYEKDSAREDLFLTIGSANFNLKNYD